MQKMAQWIKSELGNETPWHIPRFTPKWKLENVPQTPVSLLEKIIKIAKEEGLSYVYIGNVSEHPFNNTYCPRCSQIVIKRPHFNSVECFFKGNHCPSCGAIIYGVFETTEKLSGTDHVLNLH